MMEHFAANGGIVRMEDFQVACEATVAVEAAIGRAIVNTINEMCDTDEQKTIAHIMVVATGIEKFDMARTKIDMGDGAFTRAVDLCLAQLRALPIEPDGSRDLAGLCEPVSVQ